MPQTILASPYTPGNVGKEVPQTTLASPYSPGQRGKKKFPKLSLQAFTPSPPLRAMPIWKQHISKRGFPKVNAVLLGKSFAEVEAKQGAEH